MGSVKERGRNFFFTFMLWNLESPTECWMKARRWESVSYNLWIIAKAYNCNYRVTLLRQWQQWRDINGVWLWPKRGSRIASNYSGSKYSLMSCHRIVIISSKFIFLLPNVMNQWSLSRKHTAVTFISDTQHLSSQRL